MEAQDATFIAQDVILPTIFVGDGSIDLRWQSPQEVADVIVVRKVGTAPSSINDGEMIRTLEAGTTHLQDQGLHNGTRYCYRIYCRYQNGHGQSVFSKGIIKCGVPEPLPTSMARFHLHVRPADEICAVEIQCALPQQSEVIVLRSDVLPPHPKGTRLARVLLKKYGEEIPASTFPFVDTLVRFGIYYYSFWTYKMGWAYLSEIQRCIYLDDVRSVTAFVLPSYLLLQWQWPKHCQQVFLFVGRTTWPELTIHTEPDAIITYEQYNIINGYLLEVQGGQDYYLIITAKAKQEEEAIIVGTETGLFLPIASLVTVLYSVEREWHQNWRLTLRLSAPAQLPPMCLVGRAESIPLHKQDGVLIKKIDAIDVHAKEITLSVPVGTLNHPLFVGLFLQDDSQYRFFIVRPVDESKVRLQP